MSYNIPYKDLRESHLVFKNLIQYNFIAEAAEIKARKNFEEKSYLDDIEVPDVNTKRNPYGKNNFLNFLVPKHMDPTTQKAEDLRVVDNNAVLPDNSFAKSPFGALRRLRFRRRMTHRISKSVIKQILGE